MHRALSLPHRAIPENEVFTKTHLVPPVPPSGESSKTFQSKAELTVNEDGRNWPQTTLPAVAVVVYLFRFKTVADTAGLNYFPFATSCADRWSG